MESSKIWREDVGYPALYRAADAFSVRRQGAFRRLLATQLVLLVTSSLLSLFVSLSPLLAVFQAVSLTVALAIAGYLHVSKPEQAWYGARAVAESMKTLTWRFMMRADPFEVDDAVARSLFCRRLRDVLSQNGLHTRFLEGEEANPQITNEMLAVRAKSPDERLQLYMADRVRDQRTWYSSKAREKRRGGQVLFGFIAASMLASICFACLRIVLFDATCLPTDALVTLSTSLLAWMQANRYAELVASYGLTAHEIGIIEASVPDSVDDDLLADFVKEAENAFSREHTQWVARKDF